MVVIWLLILSSTAAQAITEPVGSIKTLKGTAQITRGGAVVNAQIGAPIHQRDAIETAADSHIGIILRDDTCLSLGPNSRIDLKTYIFEPQESRYSVLIRILKGTLVYLSGVIGKLSPDSVQLETPDATIAIRGTRLLIQVEGS